MPRAEARSLEHSGFVKIVGPIHEVDRTVLEVIEKNAPEVPDNEVPPDEDVG